jgi:hypothetical protein
MRAVLTNAAADHPLLAAKHPSAQEGAGRQHDGGRGQRRTVSQLKPFNHRAIIG